MEQCVLIRHGESTYNVAEIVNGDPSIAVTLSPRGAEQARALSGALERFQIDTCVHSRFPRTLETVRLALGGDESPVALSGEPLLDDIACGEMEGWPVSDEHGWRSCRRRDRRPRGGESIKDAALRIAKGLLQISAYPHSAVAVCTHELIVRYALNATAGNTDISQPWREIPHATPFAIEGEALAQAAKRIHVIASGPWGRAKPAQGANGG